MKLILYVLFYLRTLKKQWLLFERLAVIPSLYECAFWHDIPECLLGVAKECWMSVLYPYIHDRYKCSLWFKAKW